MATIREVISSKLDRFGITPSETDLDVMMIDAGVDGGEVYSSSTSDLAKKALVSIIPELLLSPSISEGGYSQKWDVEGIKKYYKILCNELGIEDKLTARITNLSDRW